MTRIAVNITPALRQRTGIGHYAAELCLELSKAKESEFIWLGPSGWQKDVDFQAEHNEKELSQKWYKILAHLPCRYAIQDFIQKKRLLKSWKKGQFDLYHESNFIPPCLDIPFVTTIHDLSFLKYPKSLPPARQKRLLKKMPEVMNAARLILTISEFSRKEILENYPVDPEKVVVTPLGIDTRFSAQAWPRDKKDNSWGLKRKEYILCVATFEPRKNLACLVRAYKALPKELKARYPLVLVGGKGWLKTGVEEQKNNASEFIHFLGYVHNTELAMLHAGAALFVFPSLYEGFGMPVTEALKSGTPVLCSKGSALDEFKSLGGVMQIEPTNEEAWTQSLKELLADEQKLKELQTQVPLKLPFSWEACAQKTHDAYIKALSL